MQGAVLRATQCGSRAATLNSPKRGLRDAIADVDLVAYYHVSHCAGTPVSVATEALLRADSLFARSFSPEAVSAADVSRGARDER